MRQSLPRWSRSTRAVAEKDRETAQRLVNQAAQKAGYVHEAYRHLSWYALQEAPLTIAKRGSQQGHLRQEAFFAAEDRQVADSYQVDPVEGLERPTRGLNDVNILSHEEQVDLFRSSIKH